MQYFFEDIEKQKKLKAILDSWEDTPFRHWCGVKGMGCDCIHFVTAVMTEVGVEPVRGYEIRRYPRDWHVHNDEELLLEGILDQMNVISMPLIEPMNGDIFLFQFGRTCSHCGIYYDDHVCQAINRVGVKRLHFLDRAWHKRKRHNFRVLT